jgi:hypothetical protein
VAILLGHGLSVENSNSHFLDVQFREYSFAHVRQSGIGHIPINKIGLNRYAVGGGAADVSALRIALATAPVEDLFPLRTFLCESMELLLAAHFTSQRSFHDISSTTHDRGPAGSEPV